MPSFSRQRKAFHDCAVLFTYDFSGSDYFWILRKLLPSISTAQISPVSG